MIAASWLKSSSTQSLFRPLEELFREDRLHEEDFYPRLLQLGNISSTQYLLPVAFNIPMMAFIRDTGRPMSNPFTINLKEIKERGRGYNIKTGRGADTVYTRMGFSPNWSDEFLFIITTLMGTNFQEDTPLTWNAAALENAVKFTQKWIRDANTSLQAEDDFSFKYLYDPPAILINSGRILFSYMDSSSFFTLTEELRSNLDYRWIAESSVIPVDEWNVYFGILKKGKNQRAARAFALWFFNTDNQRQILAKAQANHQLENSFGIAGGFSGLRTVTEHIFPQFYPGLLGHMPPESFLTPPQILPQEWRMIKETVVLPYLHERVRADKASDVRSLESRMQEWFRLNK
jgi:ABC-type glycerol-3-phosphate transport system substrate-binding protein